MSFFPISKQNETVSLSCISFGIIYDHNSQVYPHNMIENDEKEEGSTGESSLFTEPLLSYFNDNVHLKSKEKSNNNLNLEGDVSHIQKSFEKKILTEKILNGNVDVNKYLKKKENSKVDLFHEKSTLISSDINSSQTISEDILSSTHNNVKVCNELEIGDDKKFEDRLPSKNGLNPKLNPKIMCKESALSVKFSQNVPFVYSIASSIQKSRTPSFDYFFENNEPSQQNLKIAFERMKTESVQQTDNTLRINKKSLWEESYDVDLPVEKSHNFLDWTKFSEVFFFFYFFLFQFSSLSFISILIFQKCSRTSNLLLEIELA
jgi:hypothetical protein